MKLNEVAPTKTSLFDFKAQLTFSIDGHSLLEEKREVLVMHLQEIITEIKDLRMRLNASLAGSFDLLKLVQLEQGELDIRKTILGRKGQMEIALQEKSIMGINLPSLKQKDDEQQSKPQVSFNSSSAGLDKLMKDMIELKTLLVRTAQVESSAWRLAYEIKKTQRRVNALENIFIPEFKEVIKFIQETLEERERDTFFQMKRIKGAHESAETAADTAAGSAAVE